MPFGINLNIDYYLHVYVYFSQAAVITLRYEQFLYKRIILKSSLNQWSLNNKKWLKLVSVIENAFHVIFCIL